MTTPDIDEVAVERATRGWRVNLTDDERLEVIRRMNAAGKTDQEIGYVIGRDKEAVMRRRHRNGIPAAIPPELSTTRLGITRWLKETA